MVAKVKTYKNLFQWTGIIILIVVLLLALLARVWVERNFPSQLSLTELDSLRQALQLNSSQSQFVESQYHEASLMIYHEAAGFRTAFRLASFSLPLLVAVSLFFLLCGELLARSGERHQNSQVSKGQEGSRL